MNDGWLRFEGIMVSYDVTRRAGTDSASGAGLKQSEVEDRKILSAAALLAFCGATLLSGVLSTGRDLGVRAPVVAMALVVAAIIVTVFCMVRWRMRSRLIDSAASFAAASETACFVTTSDGTILDRNAAAMDRFGLRDCWRLPDYFQDSLADPGATFDAMLVRAGAKAPAKEEVLGRRGPMRLTLSRAGIGVFLWQIEDLTKTDASVPVGRVQDHPILIVDAAGKVLFMNDALRWLTGGATEELSDLFPTAAAQDANRRSTRTTLRGIEHIVTRVPDPRGNSAIYLSPLPALSGQEAAQSATPTGWAAVEDLPVALLKVGPGGEILASNREARMLLPIDRVSEPRLSDLIEGLGRPIGDWLSETVRSGAPSGPEFLRCRPPGQDRFVQITLKPDSTARDAELVVVLTDATELKSLEAQFVQSQKMQAIGQLAGGVAHDFNNLLTAISGHCDLLLLRHDQNDQDYADLIQIHQNANRAASLVGQLLAFSRKQNLTPAVMDLRDTLSELTHLLNRLVGERVTLSLTHDPALLHIRADKRQLEQVMMNLVVNARDAMPSGGCIAITTENVTLDVPLDRDRARVPAGDYVLVQVSDNGFGIKPEKLPKIFEPFFTTKRPGEGTGLGLSTVYGIIKQTGGFIFAQSVVDKGTTFSIYFPATDQPLPLAGPGPEQAGPEFARTTDGIVLLVEDEAPVRAFASRALRLHGLTVLEADSAEAALEMLSDPGLVIDIFVTDVIMPGKDGPTWVREALINRPDTRIVFVSGYAEEAFAQDQAMIPNSVFLPKPFSLNQLTSTVQRQLQSVG